MGSNGHAETYEFGGFRLEAAQRRLTRPDGAVVELPSRAFDLLLFMVERPGDLLEKSVLLKAVWPTTVVEESNLSQSVFSLRRALGDSSDEHHFITTVPGRGYQFVAKVHVLNRGAEPLPVPATSEPHIEAAAPPQEPVAAKARSLRIGYLGLAVAVIGLSVWLFSTRPWSPREPTAGTQSAGATHTIAVLPFTDMSPDRDMEYFADGIAEEMISSLSRVKTLRVVGRRSAFAFKGENVDTRTIGQKLNVESILEGSVRKDGDRIRVSAQLVRAHDGFSIWSQSYDRKLTDVLDIQGTIASQVTGALSPVIGPTGSTGPIGGSTAQTRNPDAYTAYLRGTHLFRNGTYEKVPTARDEFLKAVQLDPDFALAHAWLARSYAQIARASLDDVAMNRTLAAQSLDRALELDPQLAKLWWVRAWPGNLETMSLTLRAKNLEESLEENPDNAEAMVPVAWVYLRLGRRAEALDLYERARAADPLWPFAIAGDAGTTYLFRRDKPRALELLAEIERIAPNDPRPSAMRASMAFDEGRALDWDRWTASMIQASPRGQPSHGYLSLDYGHLGILDAALYHARMCGTLNPRSAAMHFNIAHIRMFAGDVDAARPVVREAMTTFPEDFLAQLAQAELQYFSGDCAGAIQSIQQARPAYAQPVGALDMMTDPENVPMLTWCLRKQGNTERANQLYEAFVRQHAPPVVPGAFDGDLARMAAAVGDREALLTHLRTLVETNSMRFAFAPHEPMIQPFRDDREVSALLATLEARKAEWRRIIPKSSMRVAIPDVPKIGGS